MKNDIHPTYHTQANVTCACGNSFATGSTKSDIHVEICSNCHPFYTGKQKLVDTAGVVDKFKKRAAASQQKSSEVAAVKTAKKPRKTQAEKTAK